MGPCYSAPEDLTYIVCLCVIMEIRMCCIDRHHNVLPCMCKPTLCVFCVFPGREEAGVDCHHSQLSAHCHPLPPQQTQQVHKHPYNTCHFLC